MAKIDMDWNLEKLRQPKTKKKNYHGYQRAAPWWNLFDIFLETIQEQFVYGYMKTLINDFRTELT